MSSKSPSRVVRGEIVVIIMFALGISATGLIWFYWNMHVEPFMPVQLALAEEFPNSSPRVEGGQRKMHKGTPRLLRITMRTSYDPTDEGQETVDRVEGDIRRIATIADGFDLPDWDAVEVHFFSPDPEKAIRQKSFTRTRETLLTIPDSESATSEATQQP